MLVLKEDALPYEIDPHTLETIGPFDFQGRLGSETFSAHPKVDPVSGEMVAYGYQAKGDLSDDVVFWRIGADGRVVGETWIKAPYAGIMHDIALTRDHIILPVIPMVATRERLEAGEPMWDWNGSYPTMVGVLPRDGEAKDLRWFEGPARMTLHFLNATTEGETVTMELPTSDGPGTPSSIRRWTFDLGAKDNRFGEETVSMANNPLSRIDDRYISRPNAFAFSGHRDAERPARSDLMGPATRFAANCWSRISLATGEELVFWAGDAVSLQECCFAPRSPDAPEGDGWLMGVASNYADMSSDLIVLDALTMERVATVKLPFRLRSGTHGAWVPGWDLQADG